jgi:hypothetical protein
VQRFFTVLQKRAKGQEAAPREENTAPVQAQGRGQMEVEKGA